MQYSGSHCARAIAILIVCLLSLLTINVAQASSAMVPQALYNENSFFPHNVGSNLLYFEDKELAYSIEQAPSANIPWQKFEGDLDNAPNFGFSNSAFWFRFDLFNNSEYQKEVLLEIPAPYLDNVNVVRLFDAPSGAATEIAEQYTLGDAFTYYQRPLDHENLLVPMKLAPGNNPILIRAISQGSVKMPVNIWSPKGFAMANGKLQLLQGIWFGVIGIMVVFNLFLYSRLKDLSYFYYVCLAGSYLMFQMSLSGYGFAYIWPEQVAWNSRSVTLFISLSNFFSNLLLMQYLNLRAFAPKLFKLMLIIAALNLTLVILTLFLPYTQSVRLNSAMVIITCLVSVFIGYSSWIRGNDYAPYFCFAWTSTFIGVGILALGKFGFLPSNYWTENAGQIGMITMMALFSFALASRFNREKELRIKAQASSLHNERLARKTQEELLKSRAQATKRLEQKVAERTETLEQALSELELVNERLEVMSTTDALTNLANRGHFETCLEKEFKRAQRHQHHLAIVICDIDHFKAINDTFGHKAGDECLRRVASVFLQRVNRSGDLAARYGGEEFIFLLSNTSAADAVSLAQDLCQKLADMNFHFSGKPIPITASFGVAALEPGLKISADQLVTQADLALYQAKHNGRNQVLSWQSELSA